MPATTPTLGLPYPVLSDPPNVPADIQALANALDTLVNGVTTVGYPSSASVSMGANAWTTLCSVNVTLPATQVVEIVAWARIVNSGATRPITALQVLDGSTLLFGTGQVDVPGTGDNPGFNPVDVYINTPRRAISLTAGAHTLNLQAWKDSNGTLDAKQLSTFGTSTINVTGIEVMY